MLKIAEEECPKAVRVLGGIHATFMYKQVLSEAPWVDVIVRGEGEEIFRELIRCIAEGRWPEDRDRVRGLAFSPDGDTLVAAGCLARSADFPTHDCIQAEAMQWDVAALIEQRSDQPPVGHPVASPPGMVTSAAWIPWPVASARKIRISPDRSSNIL